MKKLALMICASLFAVSALATTVDLSAEASRPAVNDLFRATVFAEATGDSPAELSKRVNSVVADAVKTAKGYRSVKTQTGGTHTYPVYGDKGKITQWRIRYDLELESGDSAALSELLGKLQASLAVARFVATPAPETRKKTEDEAMVDAIAAFQARAKLVAGAMGRSYTVKQMSIGSNVRMQEFQAMVGGGKAFLSSAAPMPVEAGETLISVNITGQIELK